MLEQLVNGAVLTLQLTILGLMIGFTLAIIFVYLLTTKKSLFTIPIQSYISFSRGVPLLVQFFILYYGCAEFECIQNSILWPILQHPFWCATLVLALNSSAYTTVLLYNAVRAIPTGEIEACKLLHLPYYQTMRRIILPRALANIWPAYSNEVIMVLKSTSLASMITLTDLMGSARQIISTTYQTFDVLILTSIIYILLACILIGVIALLKFFIFNSSRIGKLIKN